jgi:hypothetical protein
VAPRQLKNHAAGVERARAKAFGSFFKKEDYFFGALRFPTERGLLVRSRTHTGQIAWQVIVITSWAWAARSSGAISWAAP